MPTARELGQALGAAGKQDVAPRLPQEQEIENDRETSKDALVLIPRSAKRIEERTGAKALTPYAHCAPPRIPTQPVATLPNA